MGQRLIITEEEKNKIQSLYENMGVAFGNEMNGLKVKKETAEEEGEESIAPIYNGLGYVYFAQEQYDLAIRHYKEAIKLKPDYVSALNNLGHAYEKKKLNAQALEMYEATLKLSPNNTVAKRRAESLRRLVSI